VRISGMMLAALIAASVISFAGARAFRSPAAIGRGPGGQDHHGSSQFSGGYDDRLHGSAIISVSVLKIRGGCFGIDHPSYFTGASG